MSGNETALSQYMDGKLVIYLASRHLTVQPLLYALVREHSFACLPMLKG